MIAFLKAGLVLFGLLYMLPLAIAALLYRLDGTGPGWRTADRSSIGVLPPPSLHPGRDRSYLLRQDGALARNHGVA